MSSYIAVLAVPARSQVALQRYKDLFGDSMDEVVERVVAGMRREGYKVE